MVLIIIWTNYPKNIDIIIEHDIIVCLVVGICLILKNYLPYQIISDKHCGFIMDVLYNINRYVLFVFVKYYRSLRSYNFCQVNIYLKDECVQDGKKILLPFVGMFSLKETERWRIQRSSFYEGISMVFMSKCQRHLHVGGDKRKGGNTRTKQKDLQADNSVHFHNMLGIFPPKNRNPTGLNHIMFTCLCFSKGLPYFWA